VFHAALQPRVHPELEWYFKAAATPEENRAQVKELIRTASPQVREAMKLETDEGPVRWVWQRLSLLAQK
jgi:hypothetical protein